MDGEPIDVDTRKAIALLAYLSVEGQTTRDSLATLLWLDSPADRARAALRRTLSSLRSGIGSDLVISDRSTIGLEEDIDTDLKMFDRALDALRSHDHADTDVCSGCIPNLRLATDLYRGDFLTGFLVRDAPDFEDWQRTIAESYRLAVATAFNRLGTALASVGDYEGSIASVTRWIELDQLHEPAHRLLMLLNGWAGDRPGAVEAYRTFVAILDTELGVQPLEETTELYEAILDEDLPPAPGLRKRVRVEPAMPSMPSALLDRVEEFDALEQATRRTTDRGQLVVVEGASWMGKTRLVEELGSAHEHDRSVLIARAFRMEQNLPFGVVTQILRAAKPLIERHTDDIQPWVADELGRLLPEISNTPSESIDRFGELRLLEAVHSVLSTLAAAMPLIVFIDDVQWADQASISAVSYLSNRLSDVPMLLLVAVRSGETLPPWVINLLATPAERVKLEPLSADSLKELSVDHDTLHNVISRTGGVPLLVAESLASDDVEASGVERYIESRLESVGDLGRQLLAAAAVLSGICTPALLRSTSGRTEDEVVEAVDELIRKGLLRELPGDDTLSFTLDALEELTYNSTSLIRRRHLHRRAATAILENPRVDRDVQLAAAAAAQFRGAGDTQAAEWYLLAGDLARSAYANAEAAEFYETAIALGHPSVARLRFGLGELMLAEGDYSGALGELTAAASRADDSDLGKIEHRLGEVHRLLGRFPIAEEHYERATLLHPSPSLVYADWALLNSRLGDGNAAVKNAHRALELGDESDPGLMSRVNNVLGVVSTDPAEAMSHLELALKLAGDDELLRIAAMNNQAALLEQIGNSEGAQTLVEQAIELAQQTGRRHQEAALLNRLADIHHRAGRVQEAERVQTRAVTLFAGIDSGQWEPEVWLLSQW